jgi:site-specific recombinase XerD
MIEDMRMRRLNGKTQVAYIRAVRRFAGFLGRSPDTASAEDLRRFQLHLAEQGTSSMTINATITGLRFFFEITLGRGELMTMMSAVREPQKLPVVLSREEVARLLAAVRNPKHRAALSVAYGAGLRASEVAALKVGDVDGQRMTAAGRTGQGPQGPLRVAVAGAAAQPAHLVAPRSAARPDAARRVAVSRHGSGAIRSRRGN